MSGTRFPLIEFGLDVGTWDTTGEAYPDTGFEGGIAIPAGCGSEILAEPHDFRYRMADGSEVRAPTWTGALEIEGYRFVVDVVAIGNRFLIGRELLDQIEICFCFGRELRLSFLPERTSR